MNKTEGHHFWAMGCRMGIWLDCPDLEKAKKITNEIETLFQQEEQRLSRFLADSELTRLNGRAGEWVAVSPPLWRLIVRAVELAQETDGLFDPTMLNALEAAGYRHDFQEMALFGDVRSEAKRPFLPHRRPRLLKAYELIGLDAIDHAVLLPQGVRLDLGGIGKGATAQTAVSTICHDIPCLIDAGGDLVAGNAPMLLPGWPVAVKAPWSDDSLFRLWLKNGALATSGIDYRHWQLGTRQMHHLIDPRTGEPANTNLLAATVMVADACRAEAWATALMVAGEPAAALHLQAQKVEGCLIDANCQIDLTAKMAEQIQWELEWQI